MAAEFYKRTVPTYTVAPSPIYSDLYDNNTFSFDIRSGIVDEVRQTRIMLADYNLPTLPTFGSAELVGAKIGLYINSFSIGDGATTAGIRVFKMKNEIGDNEGGATFPGTLIDDEDIVQISSFHLPSSKYISEEFSSGGALDDDHYVLSTQSSGSLVTYNVGPYLSKRDGYDYGQRYGGKCLFTPNKVSESTHLDRYGQDTEAVGEHYKIQETYWYWTSVKEKKLLSGFNREKWSDYDIGYYRVDGTSKNNIKIKYTATQTVSGSTEEEELSDITPNNTFLDTVSPAYSFKDDNGSVAHGTIKFNATNALTGGYCCHMSSLYKSRANTVANIYYPEKRGVDGSDNQQVSYISKALPIPAHMYSREPTALGAGRQPVTPTVDITMRIHELAPMLMRDHYPSLGQHNFDYRLNRSIVITFGEEPPSSNESLYTYLLTHAPNSATVHNSFYGKGSSSKSIYGIAFVKFDGKIGTYHIGNAGKQSGTYDNSTWILDSARGEVCFRAAPEQDHQGDYGANWMTLSVQMHPNQEGAYYTVYDAGSGKIISHSDPYSSNRLVNLKVITTTGDNGIFADNMTYPPEYMTIWVNNYQAVKGAFNLEADMYSTGLQADSASDSNILRVHALDGVNTRSIRDSNYLALDAGQRITITDDILGAGPTDVVVQENQGLYDANAPYYTLTTSPTFTDDDYIFFASGFEPDMQITNHKTDCRVDLSIDSISLKYYNMFHENSTPTKYGFESTLRIPQAAALPNTAWQEGDDTVTDALTNTTFQPSYICLGFSSIEKLEGGIKYMLMNDFSVTNALINTDLYTDSDSDDSNIRVGYSSSEENYGRQGAADSLLTANAGANHSDTGGGESPVMSNANGTPTLAFRGLTVGKIATQEFSIESNDAGNVDYFNHKGVMRFNFDSLDRKTTSGVNLSASVESTDTTITVASGSGENFSVNDVIRIDYEEMLVTDINLGAIGTVKFTSSTLSDYDGDTITIESTDGTEVVYTLDDDATGNTYASNAVTVGLSGITSGGNLLKRSVAKRFADAGNNASNTAHASKITFNVSGTLSRTVTVTQDVVGTAGNNTITESSDEVVVTGFTGGASADVITVTRGWNQAVRTATSSGPVAHASGRTIYFVASPMKRECIFASARVLNTHGRYTAEVDDASIFDCNDGEEYILYKYNEPYKYDTLSAKNLSFYGRGTPHKTLRVVEKEGNRITFNRALSLRQWYNSYDDDTRADRRPSAFFISPKRFWLMIEILNIGGAPGWQTFNNDIMELLTEKNYKNVIGITEVGNYGSTFNESLYNDGRYINMWNLEPYEQAPDNNIELKNYGFGDFDDEVGFGGHLGVKGFNIFSDINKYKEIDISGAISVDALLPGDTLPVMMSTDEPTDNIVINVDSEIGTNPTYLTGIFKDEVPVIEDFKVAPNKENEYNLDFSWTCEDDDTWYGFLMVDSKFIHSQYHNAVIYYPFNEVGPHGTKIPNLGPLDKSLDAIQTSSVEWASHINAKAGPFYDIEGLSGFCLRLGATGRPTIRVGTGSYYGDTNNLEKVTDEMSINFHFIHDNVRPDGTLENREYLLACFQQLLLWIDTSGKLNYRQYWDTDSYIELQGTSTVAVDGETPTNIIITFDANLTYGNVKMFINGKLEDLTGEAIMADATGEQTGWYYGQNLEDNNNYLFIGNKAKDISPGQVFGTSPEDKAFQGRFEELVIYNSVLYPVSAIDGKYTFIKPLKELSLTASNTSSIAYNARLFIKDYHNIRGHTSSEVGMTSNISFKKAAFRLDNSP